MSQHEILHQSSYAHTPQQSGVAKRKNQHLVETARTLLLHSHVPFHFWGDAVFTVYYLINRMPSSILHDQIPHSLHFSYPTSLFPSSSCLWLYLFCSYSHTWTGQALRQGYKMYLLGILLTSEGLSLLFP